MDDDKDLSPQPFKRNRQAPAKTFQCRGYGECRMVFSRSEHLARHIRYNPSQISPSSCSQIHRKHTGERPFSCHCSKQFSRLDNLRQHAQTVHSDKQDLNERMMRDLTSLHATMAAANKIGGGSRGGRRAPAQPVIKEEDMGSVPIHQRPGTSTGYEGDLMYQQNHSFREPGQSFLGSGNSHSFLSYSDNHFIAVDISSKSRPSSSRPATSSGPADSQHPRSLPPLSAVVSASLSSPILHSASSTSSTSSSSASTLSSTTGTGTHLFPFPGSLALRRPTTATRPGTAPASASFFSSKPFTGLASSATTTSRSDLPLLHSGFGQGRTPGSAYQQSSASFQLDSGGDDPMSPQGHESSPFYFHPPNDTNPSPPNSLTTNHHPTYHQQSLPNINNPRKRAFASPDGPFDESSYSLRGGERPTSSSGIPPYEYGSDSRPQSRRLTVMELCNDDEQQKQQRNEQQYRERDLRKEPERCSSGSGAFLLSAAAAATALSSPTSSSSSGSYTINGSLSRPTTSSGLGLVTSASALHIFDNNSPPPTHSHPHPYRPTTKSTGLFTRSHSSTTSSTGNGVGNGDQCAGNERAVFRGDGFGNPTSTRDANGYGHGYRYGDGDPSIRDGDGDGGDGETGRSDASTFDVETTRAATTTGTTTLGAAAFGADGTASLPTTLSHSFSSTTATTTAAAAATRTPSSPSTSTSSATPTPSTAAAAAAKNPTTAASFRSPPHGPNVDDDDDDDGRKSSSTDESPLSSHRSGGGRDRTTPPSSLSPTQSRGSQQPQQQQWKSVIQPSESATVEQSQQSQFRSVQSQQQWTTASAAAQRERHHKQHRQQRDDRAGTVRLSVSPHASAAFGMRV